MRKTSATIQLPPVLQSAFENPVVDGGITIQSLAARHARLFVHCNIWQRPTAWYQQLREKRWLEYYAFTMYCRIGRHYGLQWLLPEEEITLDQFSSSWLDLAPLTWNGRQESERDMLARICYTLSFFHELHFGHYPTNYVLAHVSRWNQRILDDSSSRG